MMLLKSQYSVIYPFLIVHTYLFNCPYSPFKKSETLES